MTKEIVNQLSFGIIGCAIEVHKHLGPGLLESVYQKCLISELEEKGMTVQSEVWVPIKYKEKDLGGSLKLDLLVNNLVIVELKAVETMIPLYEAQLLSYLKLTGKPKGLLINFNSENISRQMVSLVTETFAALP